MKIALIGTGKMGNAVAEKALQAGHEIVLRINEENPQDLSPSRLQTADIAIEFTRPDAAVKHLYACLVAGIPVVCGTTGWHEQYDEVRTRFLNENGTLLTATNFSIGVNIFFRLNAELAKWMSHHPIYKPSLQESHHTQKLDKPSGTAVTLATDLIKSHPDTNSWALQESNEAGESNVLSIQSIREGQVIGIHEVEWKSPIDRISIRHEAFNRDGFAAGALIAAEWLSGKKGVFGMSDVLFGDQK
jgi:4-hydroxy-tetrahydrodipicolinate reductase